MRARILAPQLPHWIKYRTIMETYMVSYAMAAVTWVLKLRLGALSRDRCAGRHERVKTIAISVSLIGCAKYTRQDGASEESRGAEACRGRQDGDARCQKSTKRF